MEWNNLQNLFIYASTFMLVALSIDRWEAVVRPLAFTRNRNRGCYLVLGAWALAALSATPVTLHTNIKHIQGFPQCWIVLDGVGWRIYTVYVTCSVLVVPALIIAICYTHIVHTIWSKGRQVQRQKRKHQQHLEDRLAAAEQCSSSDDESPHPALPAVSGSAVQVEEEDEDYAENWVEKYALNDCLTPTLKEAPETHNGHKGGKASGGWRNMKHHHEAANSKKVATCKTIEASYQDGVAGSQHGHSVIPRARIKTIKMTLVIVVTFVLCWAPFCIINLCSVFELLPRNSSLTVALATLSQSLAHLNSAVNPIIFWMFSSKSGSTRSSRASGTSKSGTSAAPLPANAMNTCKSKKKVPTTTCDKASRM